MDTVAHIYYYMYDRKQLIELDVQTDCAVNTLTDGSKLI